jgi:hypothetical protein
MYNLRTTQLETIDFLTINFFDSFRFLKIILLIEYIVLQIFLLNILRMKHPYFLCI